METIFASRAKEDLKFWKTNLKILRRINMLIEDIKRTPFTGIGKLEPLRFEKSGYWSRRIDAEHRLVYTVVDGALYIAQCRYHY